MLPPIADRFVAGETRAEALERARVVNGDGLGAIVNLLGEHYTDAGDAASDTEAYRRLLAQMGSSGLNACISVKPTQIGLDVSQETMQNNLDRIMDRAAEADVFCWLDMEDHTTTDQTLDAFERVAREHGGVGVCVQANLKRTRADLERLSGLPGKVRLVKGAYGEPAAIAYRRVERVDREYRELLEYAFEQFDGGIGVATHDSEMIEHAARLHDRHGTPFEYQLLMGVREDLQRVLAESYPVYQYIPYGDRWLSYFARRMTERRRNLGFALRAIAGALR